ncbi:TetR/AcrR family transcriptional regulator [Nocardioides pantholopis]|uniref:TetR/AcrR family transcriptional regulator n=1 Tax=Nocardioides pantholopis TaxID=2483798 RepID=UPI000F07C0F3|nr:TetR/AcrR family transcriptional regulator [Nocardioides pantholopis]
MAPTPRAVNRAELTRAILDSATRQLAEVGPAALSVRAVARDLGLASSAVYRYVDSRDELLTRLLVRSYETLGAAAEGAVAPIDADDHAGRFAALAHALRGWARAHPHEYALLYGTPVPGYAAPADTVPSAMRITRALLGVVADAQAAGLRPPTALEPGSAEAAALEPVLAMTDPRLRPATAARGLMAWANLVGHVSQELFGHLHRGVLDYDAHFAHVVDQLSDDLGLRP